MNYESAELTKAAINFYLGASVTYANVLADLCEATGASMRAILPALRSDRRIGPAAYIRPGLGIGGGNIERDLVHLRELADAHGVDAGMLRHILDRSASRYEWLRHALERHVRAEAPRPRVAIWGLAYKKNTRSTKNSLALRVIEDFATRARLVIYDPEATLPTPPPGIEIAASAADALADADALVILTDWDEFTAFAPNTIHQTLRRPVVVDAVGALDRRLALAAGLEYVTVGEAP
jgi:UDPglucose 6-dehydrogenase